MEEHSDSASTKDTTPDPDGLSSTRSGNVFRAHLRKYAFCSSDAASATDDQAATAEQPKASRMVSLKRSPSRTILASSSKRVRTKQTGSSKPPPLNVENKLVDSLCPGLTLVMIGVNPGLTTALTGHAYSHKSNRYWPTMHAAGITPILHPASDTALLQDLYNVGHTNIVSRPTVTESHIHHNEFMEGAETLDEKIRHFRPEACAVVGKGIWLKWVEWKTGKKGKELNRDFKYGWQDENLWIGRSVNPDGSLIWPGARTIVVATTSGAAAQFAANGGEKRIELWKPLGEWFTPRREEWIKSRHRAAENNGPTG